MDFYSFFTLWELTKLLNLLKLLCSYCQLNFFFFFFTSTSHNFRPEMGFNSWLLDKWAASMTAEPKRVTLQGKQITSEKPGGLEAQLQSFFTVTFCKFLSKMQSSKRSEGDWQGLVSEVSERRLCTDCFYWRAVLHMEETRDVLALGGTWTANAKYAFILFASLH